MNIGKDGGQTQATGAGQSQNTSKGTVSKKANTILLTAHSLFLSQGYAAVSMELIARVSKTSKATVYAHFRTKEDLFMSVLDIEIYRINAGILNIDHNKKDIETTLRRVAANFIDVFLADQTFAFQRMVVGAIPQLPNLGSIVYEKGPTALLKSFAAFLGRADADGMLKIPDPMLAASQFLSLIRLDLDVLGMLAIKPPPRAQLERQTDAAIEMFLNDYL